MTQIAQRTAMHPVTVYTWDCPKCEAAMEKYTTPPRPGDDLLCGDCLDARKLAEFQANFAPVIGATVESVEPYDATLYPDDCIKSILLRAKDGHLWRAFAATEGEPIYLEAADEHSR